MALAVVGMGKRRSFRKMTARLPSSMSRRPSGAALGAYLVVSFFYLAVPVLPHPQRDLIGSGSDPDQFVWMLAWWPHAVLHGENPFVSHAVWSPQGANLAWDTSVPGLALLAAPVTLLGGPVLAYNVLAVLLPALAAWTGFLLCRHLTGSFWSSLAGGYLFGFSPYELGQSEGHLHLTSVFLVPLVALVLVRYAEDSLTGRRFVLALGALLALQIWFSTEVAFTVTLAIGVALLVGAILVAAARPRIRLLLPPLAGAYAVAAVLASPLLAYALLHLQRGSHHHPGAWEADLLNLVVPTKLTALGWSWTTALSNRFKGNGSENGAYLGLAWLVILAWFAWSFRRVAAARFLVVLVVVGVVAELGVELDVRGHGYVGLPWGLLSGLPVFDNVLPVRLSMFVALAASVCVAWWTSSQRVPRGARVALTALTIVLVVPSLWLNVWHKHPFRPAFFAQGAYQACLEPGGSVLMLPYPGRSDGMLWQAEARFAFRIADGYIGPTPEGVPRPRIPLRLELGLKPGHRRQLLAWAREQGVTAIVAAGTGARAWARLFAPAMHPEQFGGVYLFNLHPNRRPRCASA